MLETELFVALLKTTDKSSGNVRDALVQSRKFPYISTNKEANQFLSRMVDDEQVVIRVSHARKAWYIASNDRKAWYFQSGQLHCFPILDGAPPPHVAPSPGDTWTLIRVTGMVPPTVDNVDVKFCATTVAGFCMVVNARVLDTCNKYGVIIIQGEEYALTC